MLEFLIKSHADPNKVESWFLIRIHIKSEKKDPDPHQSEKVEALGVILGHSKSREK
jgi:hypothetical protein